jgi:predicted nucleic acid-binding Zn finger protein
MWVVVRPPVARTGVRAAHWPVSAPFFAPRSDRTCFAVGSGTSGVNAVEAWEQTLEAAGELTSEAADAIIDAHGDRGVTAIEAVGERRVKQYRDFTVVVGHSEEYVVEGDACRCADSRYNLDPDDPEQLCWHVVAAKVARRIDAVDHHDMWYSEVREFL